MKITVWSVRFIHKRNVVGGNYFKNETFLHAQKLPDQPCQVTAAGKN